MFQFLCRFAFQ